MKPFAQQEHSSAGRWLSLVVLLAAGFGVWFFDLVPQFRPVPSGELTTGSTSGAPPLLDSLEPVVDHTGEQAPPETNATDSLLQLIDDEPAPQDLFSEMSEPDIPTDVPEQQATSATAPLALDHRVQSAAFDPTTAVEPVPSVPATGTGIVQASATARPATVLSAETADTLRQVDSLLLEDDVVRAHRELSLLYWQRPAERSAIGRRIETTASRIFTDPHRHFGAPYLVEPGDTLESIGRQYEIPWQYLARLNRIRPEELKAGQELKVMYGPFSAVVDLSRFELTIHAHGYYVKQYRIGTGAKDRTPIGTFTVQNKLENPVWYNPDGGQVAADDPQNPLGEYWIGLGDHIGIHGTIDPGSIGTARSRGCIHMRDADIEEVYGFLSADSTVRIRP